MLGDMCSLGSASEFSSATVGVRSSSIACRYDTGTAVVVISGGGGGGGGGGAVVAVFAVFSHPFKLAA